MESRFPYALVLFRELDWSTVIHNLNNSINIYYNEYKTPSNN